MDDVTTATPQRVLGIIAGALGFLGLLFPIVRVDVGAFGIELTSATMTIWELADAIERVGDDPTVMYLIAALIAIGSLVVIVGALMDTRALIAGAILQTIGVLYFIAEIWIGDVTTVGLDVTASPQIGLVALILAPILAAVAVAIEWDR